MLLDSSGLLIFVVDSLSRCRFISSIRVDPWPRNRGPTSLLALKIRTPVANTGKLRSIGQVHVISTSYTTFEFLLLLTGYIDVVLKTKSIMDKLWYLWKLGIYISKQHNNFALGLIIAFTGKQSYNGQYMYLFTQQLYIINKTDKTPCMPTLPIYAVVYRMFKSSTAYRF